MLEMGDDPERRLVLLLHPCVVPNSQLLLKVIHWGFALLREHG